MDNRIIAIKRRTVHRRDAINIPRLAELVGFPISADDLRAFERRMDLKQPAKVRDKDGLRHSEMLSDLLAAAIEYLGGVSAPKGNCQNQQDSLEGNLDTGFLEALSDEGSFEGNPDAATPLDVLSDEGSLEENLNTALPLEAWSDEDEQQENSGALSQADEGSCNTVPSADP